MVTTVGNAPPRTPAGPEPSAPAPTSPTLVLEYLQAGLTATPGDHGGLYEWSTAPPAAEQLRLLSVLPGGEPAPLSSGPSFGGQGSFVARNAISADGSRVFWSPTGEAAQQPPLPPPQRHRRAERHQ